ncbi:hypothetical protein [Pseudoalteromonas xiamenensis]
MENKKWFNNPEMLVALTALFVGIVTTAVSVYSAYTDRAFAKASVWPKIEIYRSFNKSQFSYGVINKGTGPALIKYAKVNFDGKFLKAWHEVPTYKNIVQSHLSNSTLPALQTINPLIYEGSSIDTFLSLDEKVAIELCYCSIYGDCWLVDRSNETKEIAACSITEDEAFKQ